jgi:hypothetical protein
VPPDALPTLRHFDDMDIVYMRSGWSGDESLLAFKCGPHIGHQALAMYSYDPGGGHVHPDAGAFQLFAFDEWLIVDDGYTWKTTAYQNTVLVNGVGQDGDAAPAYKSEAGLLEFLRHVLYAKPTCWVIVDELSDAAPSTYELYFHADFPFQDGGDGTYTVEGESGSLILRPLRPADVAGRTFVQELTGTGGSPAGDIQALTLSNAAPAARTLFLTVLEAFRTGESPVVDASIVTDGEDEVLVLVSPEGERRWQLDPDRADRSEPVLVPVAVCGNGFVEPPETCDPPETCPTSCDDGDFCTIDTLVGDAAECTAECVYDPNPECAAEGEDFPEDASSDAAVDGDDAESEDEGEGGGGEGGCGCRVAR